ncbi:ThiF family adenylyltransferase [Sneathia vaginalis]|uniref:tRNA threonylcarbamoyladenosine dehydratase n=2 Tax=Leptotrichiaceae TaxID=1129771 RepID=UPI0038B6566E
MMATSYERLEILVKKEGIEKLNKSSCIIFGVGGVGSFAAEAIARSFVGNISLVDFDTVDITNINRQIHANINTVGRLKVELMKKRILSINPNCNINICTEKLSKENIEKFFDKKYDYVIDAIDDMDAKIALISYCLYKKIKIISSMGLANRLDPTKVYIGKLKNTIGCGLARRLRKEFKDKNINVVASTEHAIKHDKPHPGSVSFVPSVGGLMLASYVVRKILEE